MIIAITIFLGVLAAFAAGLVVGYSRRDSMYVEAYRNLEYVPQSQAGHAPALEV
jgi:hypothetical protein